MRFLCRYRAGREAIKNIPGMTHKRSSPRQQGMAVAPVRAARTALPCPALFYFHVLPKRQEKIGTGRDQIVSKTLRTFET